MRFGRATLIQFALPLALAIGIAAQQAPATPPATAPQGVSGAPLSVPAGGFFFVQLSDTQFGFSNNDIDFIQDTASAEFAVASVNRLKPAFVIVTGDLVNKAGDAAQIAEYDRIMAKVDRAIPVYHVAGNHDIENEPTPASVAAYRAHFGKDYYTFRQGTLLGIVLNSTLIHTPTKAEAEYAEQDRWLRTELDRAASSGAKHIVIFQHHPWFLQKADEPDSYYNIPLSRRPALLELFRTHGITELVSGHLHRSQEATDAGLHSIITGPVGRPLGGQSGFRVFVVGDTGITSRYFAFGEIPYRIGTAGGAGRGRS